jgi:hypothetical protein
MTELIDCDMIGTALCYAYRSRKKCTYGKVHNCFCVFGLAIEKVKKK